MIYTAGTDGAGLNDFVAPAIDVDGAPYGGTISTLAVKVNSVEVDSGYSVSDANVVTFDEDLEVGDSLELYRETPYEDSLVVFPNPAKYSPVHNNKSITQLLYNIQDIWNWLADRCMVLKSTVADLIHWDADDRRIINVADPSADADAVNLKTLTGFVSSALVTAGLGSLLEGTLAEADDTISFSGDVSGVLLMVAGSTFLLRQGVSAGGGTLVYSAGSDETVVTFDDPIYGAPHQYIALLFV